MIEIIKQLCNFPSAPGAENGILSYLEEAYSEKYGILRDGMENLTIVKKCGKDNAKKIMLVARTDTDGFIVNYIQDNGYLRVTKLGSPMLSSCVYGELVSDKGVHGFLVPEKGAEIKEDTAKYYVDIGAVDKAEAEKLVPLGDILAVIPKAEALADGRIGGRGVGTVVGISVLLYLLENATSENCDLYFTFTTQDCLRQRGAKTSAFDIAPDFCITVEPCESFDVPASNRRGEAVLGDGAVILAKTSDYAPSVLLRKKAEEIAEEKKIPHTTCVYSDKTTPASVISKCGIGCECLAVAFPARSIGSGAEIVDSADIESINSLISALVSRL